MYRPNLRRVPLRPTRSGAPALLGALALVCVAAASEHEQTFRLPGLDGGSLSSADLSEANFIAVVWSPASPAAQEIVPRVNQLVDTWKSKARVVTVVSTEAAAEVRTFLEGRQLKAPVYLDTDGTFSRIHSVTELPALLVFKEGRVGFAGKLPIDPDPVIRQSLG